MALARASAVSTAEPACRTTLGPRIPSRRNRFHRRRCRRRRRTRKACDAGGVGFTAKDFRTWHGTAHALALWIERSGAEPRRSAKEFLVEVARRLGNTVAVCRKSYVHPRVLEVLASDPEGGLRAALAAGRRGGLDVHERRLLAFLARP
jgi:DNA topoisomerase-1